jgi:hypothetical protein
MLGAEMLALIEKLLKGDTRVVSNFQKAVDFWRDFWVTGRDLSDEDLAREIGHAQTGFETLLQWDRYFAKSILPTAMLASLYDYDDGFGDNRDLARRALKAIEKSGVSIEVKGRTARLAAMAYGLDETND